VRDGLTAPSQAGSARLGILREDDDRLTERLYASRMGEATRLRTDIVFAATLTAVGQWEFWFGHELTDSATAAKRAAAAVCVAAATAAVSRRRQYPVQCTLLAAAALVLASGVMAVDLVSVLVAQLVLTYSAAVYAPTRIATIALVATAASDLPPASDGADVAFSSALVLGAFAAGLVVRRQRTLALELAAANTLLVEERELSSRLAADAERGRISRDLHDVVAHSLGSIVVQAELAQDTLDRDPLTSRTAIAAIAQTARDSLTDVRRILGAMRIASEPTPTLVELPQLVESYRAAGLKVDCTVHGVDAQLPKQVTCTAYLVAREALTNVLRHADGAAAKVDVDIIDDHLQLLVSDAGPGRDAYSMSSGHGLVGIRERVALAGGTSDIGNADGGGFRVLVTLPLQSGV